MLYCDSALKIEATATAIEILSTFANEQCNANQAHPIDDRQLNVLRRFE